VDEAIRELAREAGIANDWVDAAGEPRRVAIDPLRRILAALGLPAASETAIAESRARLRKAASDARTLVTATVGKPIALTGLSADKDTPAELSLETSETKAVTVRAMRSGAVVPPIHAPGYHRLRLANREITLAVAPTRCLTVGDVAADARLWGLAVQLYSLRRPDDDGFGDAGALADLVQSAAREGADAIALSPTHSLFAADPAHFGPYSPSSRLFLNPLFADPSLVFGAARVAAARGEREPPGPHSGALIDWPAAAREKYALLRRLFDDFSLNGGPLTSDFQSFVRDGGDRLYEHALFEALHQHWFGASEPKWNWNDWPADWRAPTAPALAGFAATERRAIEFHLFLQWLVARSFASVQQGARDAGMRIGLISDLAIGMSPGGSHAWSRQQDLLLGLNVGAPPDLFNTRGQDWGLTGFSPQALIARGFEPFIATLRAAMQYAGGVRIDHAMGLARLWLVPQGAPARDGAYLAYPVDDLMRLLALESHRHRAVVIAEDLGTVEPAFRKRLARAGIAGMDVLWFQRRGKSFLAPSRWRHAATAMTTTHDLPTVAGWWQGADIATRHALGLVADEQREAQERAQDRWELWRAFRKAGEACADEPRPDDSAPAVDAAVGFTARSPAPLALIPIEDILGLAEQPNVPGTIDEHPNWRRRLDQPAAQVLNAPAAQRRLAILRERRP
jgi:4-alpha-glucanotransferase